MQQRARIRLGIFCLLASGILTVIGLYLRGPIIDQVTHTDAYVAGALASTHVYAWSLLIPSLVIQCFGWIALWAYVKDTPQEGLAFWGMVLSIIGNGLFLPFTGVIAFVSPAVAQLYIEGLPAAIGIVNSGLAGSFALPFLILSALTLLIGAILHSIVLWKSSLLPTWTALPYLWHALALTFIAPLSYAAEFSGGVCLLLTTAAITLNVWRQTK
ncbi:MAG: hypothetical protein H0W44_07535 [Gammaproteobacteria bacterium]|nr:hypothetical protein [Gammaproteobacteria bacterium]